VINGEDRNLYVQSIEIDGNKTEATAENVTYKRKDGSILPYTGVMPWNGDLIFSDLALYNNSASRVGELTNSPLIVREGLQDAEINIYPNPSNGIFNIDLGKTDAAILNLEVIDQAGRSVYNKQVNSAQNQPVEVDLYYLSDGIYFLRLSSDQSVKVQRLIKY
jgi:hypothetical protein